MGLINTAISINNDINLNYRTSKYPDFIKRWIMKRNRNKLYKSISNIKDTVLFSSLMKEYIIRLALDFPNGKYLHSQEASFEPDDADIENSPIKANATFKEGFSHFGIEYEVSFIICIPSKVDKFNIISFVVKKATGEVIFKYAIKDINTISEDKYDQSDNELVKLQKSSNNIMIKTISSDIKRYLLDEINRSERILEK